MNEDIKTVYVRLTEIIDALDMRGKNVYLIARCDLFEVAKNYKFEIDFNGETLRIRVGRFYSSEEK